MTATNTQARRMVKTQPPEKENFTLHYNKNFFFRRILLPSHPPRYPLLVQPLFPFLGGSGGSSSPFPGSNFDPSPGFSNALPQAQQWSCSAGGREEANEGLNVEVEADRAS